MLNDQPRPTLWIGNVADWLTAEILQTQVLPERPPVSCNLVPQSQSKNSYGFGFLFYRTVQDASECIDIYNGRTVDVTVYENGTPVKHQLQILLSFSHSSNKALRQAEANVAALRDQQQQRSSQLDTRPLTPSEHHIPESRLCTTLQSIISSYPPEQAAFFIAHAIYSVGASTGSLQQALLRRPVFTSFPLFQTAPACYSFGFSPSSRLVMSQTLPQYFDTPQENTTDNPSQEIELPPPAWR